MSSFAAGPFAVPCAALKLARLVNGSLSVPVLALPTAPLSMNQTDWPTLIVTVAVSVAPSASVSV
jgi:hypothetical protein